eukprot:297920-Chlamydomonas_euryale.AAC.2
MCCCHASYDTGGVIPTGGVCSPFAQMCRRMCSAHTRARRMRVLNQLTGHAGGQSAKCHAAARVHRATSVCGPGGAGSGRKAQCNMDLCRWVAKDHWSCMDYNVDVCWAVNIFALSGLAGECRVFPHHFAGAGIRPLPCLLASTWG